MDAGELWVALLTTVGIALTVAGLIATWLKLIRVWRDRWLDHELTPRLNSMLGSVKQMLSRFIRRPRPVHGTIDTTLPAVGSAAGGVSWGGTASGYSSLDTRIELLEQRVRELEKSARADLRKLRDEVHRAMAEATDEARKKWAQSEEEEREQLRIALGWPAALIVLGTALQLIAAAVALCRALWGA